MNYVPFSAAAYRPEYRQAYNDRLYNTEGRMSYNIRKARDMREFELKEKKEFEATQRKICWGISIILITLILILIACAGFYRRR